MKDYKDDITHDEFEDMIQHIIPIMEYDKHFKEKLGKKNYNIFPMAQRKLHQIKFKEILIRWLSWMKTRRKSFH